MDLWDDASASIKPVPHGWTPAHDLDDAELRRRTREMFAEHRCGLTGGGPSLEGSRLTQLVDLQHEFLLRFPGADLSAPPVR